MTGSSGRYAEAFRRVEIEDKTKLVPGGMEPEDVGEFAVKAFREFGSVLIIVNATVFSITQAFMSTSAAKC